MTLADLASLGNFLSAIVVAVTLILLLLQLRQNDRNQRALVQQGRSARTVDAMLRTAEPAASVVMARAMGSDETLDAGEVHIFLAHARAMFFNVEDSFLHHRAGLLDDDSYASDSATLRAVLTIPAYRVAWRMSRPLWSGAFRDHVDAQITEVKTVTAFEQQAVWRGMMAKELAAGLT